MTEISEGVRLSMLAGELRVRNPLTRKEYQLSPQAAFELLDPKDPDLVAAIGAPDCDARTEAALAHWNERGWDVSLDYYLAARDLSYVDRADRDNSVRRALMERAVAAEPPPRRREVVGERLALPPAEPLPRRQFGQVLMDRRSVRRHRPHATTVAHVSQLLTYGLEPVRRLRAATDPDDPLDLLLKSFGVAFDFYLACYDIVGLERGGYFYDVDRHSLTRVCTVPDLEQEEWFCGMPGPRTAGGAVVMVADFAQWAYRYPHERALRDLYLEAGRIGQRLIVVGGYVGLGTLVTPAARDSLINGRLHLDPAEQSAFYSVIFGVDDRKSPAPPRL